MNDLKLQAQIDKQQATVWSTKSVNQYVNDVDNGIERKDSPFFMGNNQLRKPNLLFEYTQDEINELMKCKRDVNYFANNYAYTMNPSTGSLKQITLRDYQEDLLNAMNDNRYTVVVASRQCGKCSIGNESVELENGEVVKLIDLYDEGGHGFLRRVLTKIKRWLYKVYGKL